MKIDDIVYVWCYRGYRPGWVKTIGKRKVQVHWADGKCEWIDLKRIKTPETLREKAELERHFKLEKEISQ